jgi:hypothetical protein
MAHRTETIRTINLDHDQMLIFDGGRDGRVRVLHGGAWLTEEGDAADAFLRAGGQARFHGRRTLIGALGPTQLQVAQPDAGAAGRMQALWRRARGVLRRVVARHQLGAAAAQAQC